LKKKYRYGRVAIAAAERLQEGHTSDPAQAWRWSAEEVFSEQPASQKKSCPRGAFLGLCEEGLVRGVAPGKYTRARLNKQYAVEAVRLLRLDPRLKEDPALLWAKILGGKHKAQNSQIEVVIALMDSGFIQAR